MAGLLCLMKYILAGVSRCALRSVVFGTLMCFWTLWLFELLYVCLDKLILMLFSIWVRPKEWSPKTMLVCIAGGFWLSSSLGLCGRGAGRDVIPSEAK